MGAALLAAFPASAAAPGETTSMPSSMPSSLAALDAGLVEKALDGQTLLLDDGRVVRLAGILAPEPPLGLDREATWRRAAEAADALQALAAGRAISLYGTEKTLRIDHHGRLLAQVTLHDGPWLQGALLSTGRAWVYTAAEDGEIAPALYRFEAVARAAGRGIWADPYYAVHCAGDLNNATDATRVVQGRVLDVADINGALYLNFGADWRSDFTIRVERRDRRRLGWRETPLHLVGQLVEVRGWVYWFNGPVIDLDHGARLRLLDPGSPLANPACHQTP